MFATNTPSSPSSRPLALVTGASSGIGKALAQVLAEHGHDLVLVARHIEPLDSLGLALAQAHGAQVHVIAQDLSVAEGPQRLFEQVSALNLQPAILVNNAGVGLSGAFKDTALTPELAMLQLNMLSLVALTKLFLPGVIAQRGKVLNVASTGAFQPGPGIALYFASKAFVLRFSQALQLELRELGVAVCVVCPGPTDTRFQEGAGLASSRAYHWPWVRTPQQVAQSALRALQQGRQLHVPGWANALLAAGSTLAPQALTMAVLRWLTRRG